MDLFLKSPIPGMSIFSPQTFFFCKTKIKSFCSLIFLRQVFEEMLSRELLFYGCYLIVFGTLLSIKDVFLIFAFKFLKLCLWFEFWFVNTLIVKCVKNSAIVKEIHTDNVRELAKIQIPYNFLQIGYELRIRSKQFLM